MMKVVLSLLEKQIKRVHCQPLKQRICSFGYVTVVERYEYKTLMW